MRKTNEFSARMSVNLISASLLLIAAPAVAGSPKKVTTVAATKPVPPQALPVFEFKGVRAGDAVDLSTVSQCDAPDENGEIGCRPANRTVAGLDEALAPRLVFYKNRLTSMIYIFHRDNFLTLLDAFTQKYGAPCATRSPKWTNGAGASLDNTEVEWCFRTGKLVLTRISDELQYGDANYIDIYQAPSKPAPVDF